MPSTSPSWADVGVPADLARVLTRSDRPAPFAIQTATLADSLAGRDICGKAPTGSGKTLAFAIPAVANCREAAPHAPSVLILTPTRELAAQIREELAPMAAARGLVAGTFYGGTKVGKDIRLLERGVDIAVATPGRLEDLINQREIDLGQLDLVILDEADRMADMGFLPVVKRLLDATPAKRQTLLFSATLDGDVDVLITRYQRNPARHEVAQPAKARGDVQHHFWAAHPMDRRQVAAELLGRVDQAIVFARTKRGADRLAKNLGRDGISCVAIHGDRTQSQREKALHRFTTGQVKALVATDVAARGIHVDDVSAVLHFDMAGSDKDYVHRSGRTGRAGADGIVVTLVRPDDRKDAEKMLRDLSMDTRITDPDYDAIGRTRDDAPTRATATAPARATAPTRDGGEDRGEPQVTRTRPKPRPRPKADAAEATPARRQRKGPNSSRNKGRPRRLREADRA